MGELQQAGVDMDYVAKELMISVDELIKLDNNYEVELFDSAKDCFKWLYMDENATKDMLYDVIEELSELKSDNLGDYRAYEVKVIDSDGVILQDGRVVFVYG